MPDLSTTISVRFSELVAKGTRLMDQFQEDYAVDWRQRSECVSWLLSAGRLLEVALPQGNRHLEQARRLLPNAEDVIFPTRIAAILGILRSAQEEWSRGLLLDLEFKFVGPAFAQFLSHASEHLANQRKVEAAVLASAVLEDTVKKVCGKFGVDTSDKELDTLISALSTRGVLGKVKAQRLRAAAAVRNKAFHADWNSFDERDVKQMIESIEELVEAHSSTLPA